jgi:hypothetical protein
MRTCCILLVALFLGACAVTDPYTRADAAATGDLTEADIALAFNSRWPARFKCVQTVTLDFGVQTRTLTGYLIVDQPGRFRLQGMTEQGLKLFDVIGDGSTTTVVFAVEEFDAKVIDSIARDIRRVFLAGVRSIQGQIRPKPDGGRLQLGYVDATMRATDSGTTATLLGLPGDLRLNLVGATKRVDWYEYIQSGRALYRVDQYEWQDAYPSTIVLREPGIQSDGPPYKLTIKITELTVRDKPWPDKMFTPPEKDD